MSDERLDEIETRVLRCEIIERETIRELIEEIRSLHLQLEETFRSWEMRDE